MSDEWRELFEKLDEIIRILRKDKCVCPTEEDLGWEAVDKKYISSWDE